MGEACAVLSESLLFGLWKRLVDSASDFGCS